MPPITETDAWAKLAALRETLRETTLSALFAADPGRGGALAFELDGLWLDLTRQRLTPEALAALTDLAEAAGLAEKRRRLFAGERINATEGRAVMHMALRDDGSLTPAIFADTAWEQRERFLAFAEEVRAGGFTDVVNIGIGGSHVGPMAATEALSDRGARTRVLYVANVDGVDLSDRLMGLDPSRTMFLIASKTFTTAETMANALSARAWLAAQLGEEAVPDHFAALSAAPERAAEFGIRADRVFPFEDWVGGRFSLWSAVGASTAIAIGRKGFEDMLRGAHAMDRHFTEAPTAENLPALLALTDFWNRNFLGLPVRAVLPYDERLKHLPAYLQQLEMESNGKGVTLAGDPVAVSPAAVVFGMTGTNGQHAFHQMLHQGEPLVAAEFIGIAQPGHTLQGHHEMLLANMLAQAEALALGTPDPATPHHNCPGNRPSSVILVRRLDPFHLGMLLAMYEHKIFVEGVLAGINSFDQYGVELGKKLAGPLLGALETGPEKGTESGPVSAAALKRLRDWGT